MNKTSKAEIPSSDYSVVYQKAATDARNTSIKFPNNFVEVYRVGINSFVTSFVPVQGGIIFARFQNGEQLI